MDIQLLPENESLHKLSDQHFISIWQQLAKDSESLTLIQEVEFASSWYQSYLHDFKPLLVIGFNEAKDIIGILPLAISRSDKKLSHAGQDQAEYNGWICKKNFERTFLTHTLITIKKQLVISDWEWTWMPPNTDVNCLDLTLLRQHNIYINQVSCESPIYALNDTKRINKIKKSKAMKSKNNRLNRKGELRIERITDKATTEKIITDIIRQCNFRHLSLYNYMPFESDKNKAAWHLNQMKNPRHVHFTVLWQGDRLLACNYGYCTDDTVMVGLFTYDPIEGANSPGNIFLIKLIEYITEEGYTYLDLTPGGDEYKERFCNQHNTLIKPTICFNRLSLAKHFIKSSLRHYVKKQLNGRFTIRDIASLQAIKEKGLLNSVKNRIQYYKKDAATLFVYDQTTQKKQTKASVNINQYSDLLAFNDAKSDLSHKEVVHSALRKFQRGDQLFTIIIDNTLLAFAWLALPGKKHWVTPLKNIINEHKQCQYIYDVYINEENKLSHHFNTLTSCIIETSQQPTTYLLKPLEVDCEIIQSAGFISHDAHKEKDKNALSTISSISINNT